MYPDRPLRWMSRFYVASNTQRPYQNAPPGNCPLAIWDEPCGRNPPAFTVSEGDRIRLNLVDGDATLTGDQSLSFIGTWEFTGAAGELRYGQAGEDTFLEADTNADGPC